MAKVNPIGAWLTVNRACQLRCKWCYAEGTQYQGQDEMDLELAQDLTNILCDLRISPVRLIGGEPSLWRHLFDFNSFCRGVGIDTSLVTNSVNFGNDRFWEKYKANPCTNAGISVKAGNSEQFVDIVGVKQGVFGKVAVGIRRYVEEFGSVGVGITYNSLYKKNLGEIVGYAIDAGANSVKIDFCHPSFKDGAVISEYMEEPRELAKNIEEMYPSLHEITEGRLFFEMNVPFCIWSDGFIELLKSRKQIYSVCQLQKKNGLIFDTNGSVLLCNGLYEYPLGTYGHDFHDASSLLELMNNENSAQAYDRILAYPADACKDCSWWEECAGGCPMNWAVYDPESIVQSCGGAHCA
ncbi:radical SAM/SPASM domain-containing protein [Magnetospira sp. QH-2]|uniref:radical SAM/SPASM domain-containing protein n=1 Tax=Magnetospira sp. (strain QH-2) TaxID=1288970 RepID=UPI0003E8189D|nr:radical SAM protein [Magnetospira sp. QH-2]CCQ74238.1 Protein of unknown function [Magnetospira sp. QH-2]